MYETLFLLWWFIFVPRKRFRKSDGQVSACSDLSFLKWTLLVAVNAQFHLPTLSAFENGTSKDINEVVADTSQFSGNITNGSDREFKNDSHLTNNFSSPTPAHDPIPVQSLFFRHTFFVAAIYIVAYSLVFLIGLIGNCVVMIVVIRSSRMRNATNFFICNLAFADTLVIVCCLPTTLLGHLLTPWVLGIVLCKLVSYLQGVAVSASINTLVAVSIERYLAICFPFKRPMSRRKARKWTFIIWTISLSIAMPWAFFFKTIPYNQRQSFDQSSMESNSTTAHQPDQENSQLNSRLNSDHIVISDRFHSQKIEQITGSLNDDMSTPLFTDFYSSFEWCESKRMIEFIALNDIHRLILKTKIFLVYQLATRENGNKLENNKTSSFLSQILQIPLDFREHLMYYNPDENLIQNLGHLDQLIKNLSAIVCKCYDANELFFVENDHSAIDRQLSIQKSVSNLLNSFFDDNTYDWLDDRLKNNELINSMIMQEHQRTFKQLNLLESDVLEAIESRKNSFPLKISECASGCESNSSQCALLYMFTKQNDLTIELNENNNSIDKHFRFERSTNSKTQSSASHSLQVSNFIVRSENFETCTEQWPNQTLERTYFIVANLILGYLLPLIIISACYIAIWVTVWTRDVPCEKTTETTTNTPTFELPHHSCRTQCARKQIDQQSIASSSRSTKSFLINRVSGLKKNFLNSSSVRMKHSSADNLSVYPRKNLPRQEKALLRNQNLIVKIKRNQNDCHRCGKQLNSDHKTYISKKTEDCEIVNDRLIREDQQCSSSISGFESNSQGTVMNKKRTLKSILVSNYDKSDRANSTNLNTKQQIIITIDPNSESQNANNSSPAVESASSRVCKRLYHKFKIWRRSGIELNGFEKPNSQGSMSSNNQTEHHHHLNNGEIRRLMKSDHLSDLDYEIEQIDRLEQNFKLNLIAEQSNNSVEPKQKTRDSEIKRNEDCNHKLIARRTFSKQSICVRCIQCSNINNKCECQSHIQVKQPIKPTKSTPITGLDRLTLLNEQCISRNMSSNNRRTNSKPLKFTQNIHTDSAQLNNRTLSDMIKNSRFKVAKMMIVIILVFFICWLPLYIIFIKLKLGLQFTSYPQTEDRITFLLTPVAQSICYLNSCVNPILYNFLNKRYRAEFRKLFSNVRCFCLSHSNKRITTNQITKPNQTSTILRASIRSHPSIHMNYDRNTIEKQKNHIDRNLLNTSNHVERNSIVVHSSPTKLTNDLKHSLFNQTRPTRTRASLNRSLSDSNLRNQTIPVKRLSFSGSINLS